MATTMLSCKDQSKLEEKQKNDFASFLQAYNDERIQFFPFEGTYLGDTLYNHLLPNDLTQKYDNDLKAMFTKYLEGLKQYDIEKLSIEEKISYEILKWECEVNIEDEGLNENLLPINQFESMQLIMGTFASGEGSQPFKTVKDYDNWLQRLDAYTIWLDSALVNMNTGIKKGIVLPKALTVKMIPQFEEMTTPDVTKHHYYRPILKMPATFSSVDKARLAESYSTMIKEKLLPRFLAITNFLKDTYLPASRLTSGINALNGGEQYYKAQIKKQTTTLMSADEIHQVGLKEVARIRGEMEKVMTTVGFKGDLKAFFDHVRTKKELMPFTNPDQVIENFNAIHTKMKPNLAVLFDLMPKSKFEVRRTESFREVSASAEYIQGSLDGKRPGVFYVPIPEVKEYNMYSDEDLFLHEAIPGHHYQVSIQQENELLPAFRKTLWYGAYGEGWALYTESLGKELGLYNDPYQYFGMLGAEIHRAIRLVVDTGIHTKGWSREKAIQYSLDNEAESEASIISEIERYMSWPGQAVSYKIGQLKIRELRNKIEQRDGAKFDIKKFHRMMLESGCLPLAVLEKKMLG